VGQGGGGGKVLYVDTEKSFRHERIEAIAQRYNMDPSSVLDNIAVATAQNTDQQMELIKMASKLCASEPYVIVCVSVCVCD